MGAVYWQRDDLGDVIVNRGHRHKMVLVSPR